MHTSGQQCKLATPRLRSWTLLKTGGLEPCTTGRPWLLMLLKKLNMSPSRPLASIIIELVYVSRPGDVGLDGWVIVASSYWAG